MKWVKSSYSNSFSNCVEVARAPDGSVFVRDSKDGGTGPVLRFTRQEWAAFLEGAMAGEFDHLAGL
jgi:hypothetical protein